jgi:hypothetical protein
LRFEKLKELNTGLFFIPANKNIGIENFSVLLKDKKAE